MFNFGLIAEVFKMPFKILCILFLAISSGVGDGLEIKCKNGTVCQEEIKIRAVCKILTGPKCDPPCEVRLFYDYA